MQTIYFQANPPQEVIRFKNKTIFCFFNLHNIWWAHKNNEYTDFINSKKNEIFPDGRIISRFLKIPQQRGPEFTQKFLKSEFSRNKRHFFIGLEESDLQNFSQITGIKASNVVPYHSDITKNKDILFLPETELKKISSLIKKQNSSYVWIGISSPKQEFIANQLFDSIKKEKIIFVCIGAGKDFLLGKKKESPKYLSNLGIEWLYRLLTDFNHSKLKVLRHFLALSYIISGRIKIRKK